MIRIWRARPVLATTFLLATALTLYFAVHVLSSAIYWASHRNVELRPWMTAGYIARSWSLKGPDLDAVARLPGPKVKGHPQTLSEIARDRGVPVADVIAEVKAAIEKLQAARPQP